MKNPPWCEPRALAPLGRPWHAPTPRARSFLKLSLLLPAAAPDSCLSETPQHTAQPAKRGEELWQHGNSIPLMSLRSTSSRQDPLAVESLETPGSEPPNKGPRH